MNVRENPYRIWILGTGGRCSARGCKSCLGEPPETNSPHAGAVAPSSASDIGDNATHAKKTPEAAHDYLVLPAGIQQEVGER